MAGSITIRGWYASGAPSALLHSGPLEANHVPNISNQYCVASLMHTDICAKAQTPGRVGVCGPVVVQSIVLIKA